MTIAHVTYGMGMGGIESMLVNISHFQAQEGHNVHIVVINDIIDNSLIAAIDPRVKLHRLGRKEGSKNPWYVFKLNACLGKIKPDVVHLHFSSISKFLLLPGLRRKFCNTLHNICNPTNTDNIQNAGPVFAISEVVGEDLVSTTGMTATVVRNGINPHLFKQRNREGITGRVKLVQVARLNTKNKGQDILLQAVAKVIALGADVDLTLIGDGPSIGFLQQMARDLGISDRVNFLGNKSQQYIFEHLADYDVMVHPSRIEGFGLTVAEAMASMVPVVVSDNDGPMEIIDGGKYGKHFPSGDADACAEKIMEVINHYPSRQELTKARKRVLNDFNVENTAKRYVDMYRSIVLQH